MKKLSLIGCLSADFVSRALSSMIRAMGEYVSYSHFKGMPIFVLLKKTSGTSSIFG
jgi:hypothetical protein